MQTTDEASYAEHALVRRARQSARARLGSRPCAIEGAERAHG